jgi:hypothetical protein
VLPGWIDTDLTRRARREVDGLQTAVEVLDIKLAEGGDTSADNGGNLLQV